MAEVLAVVPQVGLEALSVAVDLVLEGAEGATPNGSMSAEYARNVLGRLNAPKQLAIGGGSVSRNRPLISDGQAI